jgi:hypothetical protein
MSPPSARYEVPVGFWYGIWTHRGVANHDNIWKSLAET